MYSAKGHLASPRWGCPIRTSPDHSLLAAPRGLSQPSTSFIGSWCQGIHRAPLLARRLDLSTSPSRQDQRSQKDKNQKKRVIIFVQTQHACRRTLAESECLLNYSSILQVHDQRSRSEHQSGSLDSAESNHPDQRSKYRARCDWFADTKIARHRRATAAYRKSSVPTIRLSTPGCG